MMTNVVSLQAVDSARVWIAWVSRGGLLLPVHMMRHRFVLVRRNWSLSILLVPICWSLASEDRTTEGEEERSENARVLVANCDVHEQRHGTWEEVINALCECLNEDDLICVCDNSEASGSSNASSCFGYEGVTVTNPHRTCFLRRAFW